MKLLVSIRRWCSAGLLCGVALAAVAPALGAASPRLLVVGDSLSAEYGLPRDTGWVKLLADRISQGRAKYSVVNGSISGETTSGGRTRMPALLDQHRPAVVVIALGANDGLRGLSLPAMRENLVAMVDASRAAGARVLLVGVRIPPNYGRDYSERFFATFGEVSRERSVPLVPFMLEASPTNWSTSSPTASIRTNARRA